jgi:hypothetical protein
VFDGRFGNELGSVFNHIFLIKFNFSKYVGAFAFDTHKTGETLAVNRP